MISTPNGTGNRNTRAAFCSQVALTRLVGSTHSAARPSRSSTPGTQAQRCAEDEHRAQAARAGRRGDGLRGGRAVCGLQAPLLRDGGGVVHGGTALAGEDKGGGCK